MSQFRHDVIVVLIAVAAAWFTPWVRTGWSLVAVPESYSTTLFWLDYAFLSLWAFEFLWAALLGVFLTRSLHSRGALWWSLLLGLGLGLFHFAFSIYSFAPDVPASVYVWAYGQHLMPILGATTGSLFVAKYWPSEQRASANAA